MFQSQPSTLHRQFARRQERESLAAKFDDWKIIRIEKDDSRVSTQAAKHSALAVF